MSSLGFPSLPAVFVPSATLPTFFPPPLLFAVVGHYRTFASYRNCWPTRPNAERPEGWRADHTGFFGGGGGGNLKRERDKVTSEAKQSRKNGMYSTINGHCTLSYHLHDMTILLSLIMI